MTGYVYILANRPNSTLYVGVTGNIGRRIHEHRTGEAPGFSRRYGLKTLVYIETCETIEAAIQREKTIKKWPRQWKLNAIEEHNPQGRRIGHTPRTGCGTPGVQWP